MFRYLLDYEMNSSRDHIKAKFGRHENVLKHEELERVYTEWMAETVGERFLRQKANPEENYSRW